MNALEDPAVSPEAFAILDRPVTRLFNGFHRRVEALEERVRELEAAR